MAKEELDLGENGSGTPDPTPTDNVNTGDNAGLGSDYEGTEPTGENPDEQPDEELDSEEEKLSDEIDCVARLAAFKEKFNGKKFATPASTKGYFTKHPEDRAELELLYKHFFNKEFSNCTDCLLEAFIQVLNHVVDEAKEECPFLLYAGALLQDNVTFNASNAMSNHNITTDMCLLHLSQNPHCIDKFQKIPDNWEKMVEAYKVKNK